MPIIYGFLLLDLGSYHMVCTKRVLCACNIFMNPSIIILELVLAVVEHVRISDRILYYFQPHYIHYIHRVYVQHMSSRLQEVKRNVHHMWDCYHLRYQQWAYQAKCVGYPVMHDLCWLAFDEAWFVEYDWGWHSWLTEQRMQNVGSIILWNSMNLEGK